LFSLILSIGIKEVFYGCANDKFGGCGSILSLNLGHFEPCKRFISDLNLAVKSLVIGSIYCFITWKLAFNFSAKMYFGPKNFT
jgi:hypothetical protein